MIQVNPFGRDLWSEANIHGEHGGVRLFLELCNLALKLMDLCFQLEELAYAC